MTTSSPSVQLYTVRDAIATDLPGALERIAGLGFTSVELFGFVDRAAEYAELLPKFGLTAPTAHGPILGTDPTPALDAAKRIGVSTVIHPAVAPDQWTTKTDVAATALELNRVAALAAAEGISVGYHNHWWELENSIDGMPPLEFFASLLDPGVVLEVDTYWATVGGVPAIGLLERLGDRVTAIHVKDGPVSRDNQQQVAVGNGAMPVLEILAAVPNALKVVELDDFDGDVFEAVADSMAFLRANGYAV